LKIEAHPFKRIKHVIEAQRLSVF